MKRIWVALLAAMMVAGCGSRLIEYKPSNNPSMTRKDAISIVEQVFYEDYKQKPAHVEVTGEYLLLSDGIVSTTSGFASAVPAGNAVMAAGDSVTVTKSAGQRIYWRSLDKVTIHQRKGRTSRYILILRRADGGTLRHVGVFSLQTAQSFVDAVQVLKRTAR